MPEDHIDTMSLLEALKEECGGEVPSWFRERPIEDSEEGRSLREIRGSDLSGFDPGGVHRGEEEEPQTEKSEGQVTFDPEGVVYRCAPCRKVFVAIPSYGGKPSAETLTSVVMIQIVCRQIGVEVGQVLINSRDPYLDRTRNSLVTAFLDSDCTDLLFIDDDVSFEPNAVARILMANRPFVACVYPKKTEKAEYPCDFLPGTIQTDMDGYIEAAMVPTGFLRLNRAVFSAMPYTEYPLWGTRQKGYFRTFICDKGYIGEDVIFSHQWRALGGHIYIIPNVTLWHTGLRTWEGNLHNHLMQTLGGGVL